MLADAAHMYPSHTGAFASVRLCLAVRVVCGRNDRAHISNCFRNTPKGFNRRCRAMCIMPAAEQVEVQQSARQG